MRKKEEPPEGSLTNYIFLPDEIYGEPTANIPPETIVTGDGNLTEALNISKPTLYRWKASGIIDETTYEKPRPKVYLYNLRRVIEKLQEAGYIIRKATKRKG